MIDQRISDRFVDRVSEAQQGSDYCSGDASWRDRLRSFINCIPDCEGPALVLGPGAGDECFLLQERGFEVSAIDIERQKTEHHEAMILHGVDLHVDTVMERMPFDDGSFGLLSSHHVLEHSLAPLVALCEYNRVLRTGGILALGVPPLSGSSVELHINNFSRPLVVYLLAASGFDASRVRYSRADYDERFIVEKVTEPLRSLTFDGLSSLLPEQMIRYYPETGNRELVDIFQ